MSSSRIDRYEFLPFDLGRALSTSEYQRSVIDTLAQDGWQDATSHYDKDRRDILIPYGLGLFRKDDTELYLAESGYGVARILFSSSAEDDASALAEHLHKRVLFQQAVERREIPDALTETANTLADIQRSAKKPFGYIQRDAESFPLFEYSLTAFHFIGITSDDLLQAALNPRSVGMSIATSQDHLTPIDVVCNHLDQGLELDEPCQLQELSNGYFGSSWSSAVIATPDDATSLLNLLTLAEYRTQSSWLAAFRTGHLAASLHTPREAAKNQSKLEYLNREFDQIVVRTSQRLGPNSPSDLTAVVDELKRTSDLEVEIESATSSLESARSLAEFGAARQNARGRRLLELFALLFASSGLAELMFELPITSDTISDTPVRFCIWFALTIIGIALTFRQKF